VSSLGYPKEILDFKYRSVHQTVLISRYSDHHLITISIFTIAYHSAETFRRGLIIDKKSGNILKLDRHKYVRLAFHGTQRIPKEQRKQLYTKHVESFSDTSRFVNIDTIFLLVGKTPISTTSSSRFD
jgi:hypothetical protein